jgi:hypothetical protein
VLLAQFEETFPEELAETIGKPVNELVQEAANHISSHASALVKVLWGQEVWKENFKEWRDWWLKLSHSPDKEFLIIELILSDDMQKYIWESLLTQLNVSIDKVAIVRMQLEDDRSSEILQVPRDSIWLTLVSEKGDLRELPNRAKSLLSELKIKGWPIHEVGARNEGDLDNISRMLRERHKPPVAFFLYVGHGEVEEDQARVAFIMEDERQESDPVDVARLQTAFDECKPAILLLVACNIGMAGLVNELLSISNIVVAMQLPLSPDAAMRFLEGFFKKPRSYLDLYSVEGLARAVGYARQRMHIGAYSRIEVVTPVIYSRVPTEISMPTPVRPIKVRLSILVSVASSTFQSAWRCVLLVLNFIVASSHSWPQWVKNWLLIALVAIGLIFTGWQLIGPRHPQPTPTITISTSHLGAIATPPVPCSAVRIESLTIRFTNGTEPLHPSTTNEVGTEEFYIMPVTDPADAAQRCAVQWKVLEDPSFSKRATQITRKELLSTVRTSDTSPVTRTIIVGFVEGDNITGSQSFVIIVSLADN